MHGVKFRHCLDLSFTLLHPEAFLRHKWRSLGRQLTVFEVPRLAVRQSHRAPLCSFRLVRVKYVSTKSRIVFRCAVSCMSHVRICIRQTVSGARDVYQSSVVQRF